MRDLFFDYTIDGDKDPVHLLTPYNLSGDHNMVRATEFIVITKIGMSPVINNRKNPDRKVNYNGYIDVHINAYSYFSYNMYDKTDNPASRGVSNLVSPLLPNFDANEKDRNKKRFRFHDWDWGIYLMPGRSYQYLFTMRQRDGDASGLLPDEYIDVVIAYTLYDGTDAILAKQLLEMGYPVAMGNLVKLRDKMISTDPNWEPDWKIPPPDPVQGEYSDDIILH